MSVALVRDNRPALSRQVLVLNKLWTPHRVDSMRDAIGLLFPGGDEPKAKIIDVYDNFSTYEWEDWSKLRPQNGEVVLYGAKEAFRIPEVLLLSQYDKMPQNRIKFSRRMIHRRDENRCQYCGRKPLPDEISIDHVLPRSLGGETTWKNCVLACLDCNQKKNNRTPQQAGMKLRREPFKPKFELFKAEKRKLPRSWMHFLPKSLDKLVSEVYWNVPLENDEKD